MHSSSINHSSSNSSRLDKPFFAFDLDGVVKQGEVILPAGKRALKRLKSERIPFCIVTNSGGSGEVERAKKLSDQLEVEISPDQLVLSHTVMKSLTKLYSEEPILMIGGPEVPVGLSKSVMKSYGFNNIYTSFDLQHSNPASYPFGEIANEQVESALKNLDFSKINFKAILVFHDSRDWCRDLQYMLDLLRSKNGIWGSLGDGRQSGNGKKDGEWKGQIPVYFSHNDLLWGNDFPVSRLGQGSFKVALESIFKSVTDYDLISKSFGKPHTMTYEYADLLLREQSQKLGFSTNSSSTSPEVGNLEKERVWMVGDNPDSDILGAIQFKWSSALVKTGVWKEELGQPKHKPTIITEDVEEAVEEAFRIQKERAQRA